MIFLLNYQITNSMLQSMCVGYVKHYILPNVFFKSTWAMVISFLSWLNLKPDHLGKKAKNFKWLENATGFNYILTTFTTNLSVCLAKKKNLITLLRKNELEMPNSFSKILDLQFMVVWFKITEKKIIKKVWDKIQI